ncbi:zf-HC2 domain-containing protein [Metallumcola ferriviriculae]|uniref:Anti-sigma-W factor RsiW n=1 Tax=Metallumcola ferriviriculae TaxID=3039180 RepID=A0AAU0UNJ6_9FIRM|nr:zf-HC2 domain-containing protein [Desulfitibacteraceae bacterium MK1]
MDEIDREQCEVIQDLLPIYADDELSAAGTKMVEEHLAGCRNCKEALLVYKEQLFEHDEIVVEENRRKFVLLPWVSGKRLAWVLVLILFIGAGGLSWAYQAGKVTALRDPEYRRAFKENLFTPVHQTKKIGPYEVTVERMLIDAAQTVVFYEIEPEIQEGERLELVISDQDGRVYEPMSGFSYSGEEHVLELKPVSPKASQLSLAFRLEGAPAEGEFIVAVEPAAVQASTSEWWPGIKREAGPVEFGLEHVILGLTKSQVNLRAFWPLDQDIRGVGFGLFPPVGPKMREDGSAGSASGSFYNVRPGMAALPWYAELVDMENRRKAELEQLGLKTDSLSGGITASFNFQPLPETTSEVQFTLPNTYLYRYVNDKEHQEISIELNDGQEEKLDKTVSGNGKQIRLTSAKRERSALILQFELIEAGSASLPSYVPEFIVVHPKGFETPGRSLEFSSENGTGTVMLYSDEWPTTVRLKSIGEQLDLEHEFNLPVPTANF